MNGLAYKPIYLLAGSPGVRQRGADPLLARALATAGIAQPTVAYIGAASNDNWAFYQMMAPILRRSGAGQVNLAPLAGKRTRLDKARAILEAADIIYISGGDVEAGMEVLEERGIIPFLRGLYAAGKPFFGISAGSIMLARQWVRWRDPHDDTTAELFPCLGFAPILCDTHGEGDGWEELQALLRLEPEGTIGYGIPSGAGLCVYPDGKVEALGAPANRYAHQWGRVVRMADLPLAAAQDVTVSR